MYEGILPVNKPIGHTSFSLVSILRRRTRIQCIGHTGTLDPFAGGVMVLLIGKPFTRQSDRLLAQDKEYSATLHLGVMTDTYDRDGKVVGTSSLIPTWEEIENALLPFQGRIRQTPPMFCAKKIQGKKLYELARKGITIAREPVEVTVHITLLKYAYPHLDIHVRSSKGAYIRSLAQDIGTDLGCYANLSTLTRVRNGTYTLQDCCDGTRLSDPSYDLMPFLTSSFEFIL